MALNDKSTHLAGNKGANVYPGVANPIPSSNNDNPISANFVDDPTSQVRGAGAGPNFDGHKQAARNSSGVVEGYPGIIESSNIDPLNENSNKDDGWANVPQTRSTTQSATGMAANAANAAAIMASGAAKLAYGTAMGDEASKEAGKEAIWGSK